MRIKFIFSETDKTFTGNTNHIVKSWFNHDVLNDEPEYHNGNHAYALSDIMGKKFDEKGKFHFDGEPYVIFSTNDDAMAGKVAERMFFTRPKLLGLNFVNVQFEDIKVHKGEGSYDILSFMKSPLLLREKKFGEKYINYTTAKDDNFIEKLTEQTRRKLSKLGVEGYDTISFEVFHPEGARVCRVDYKDRWNVASRVHLIVKGDPKAREVLYTVGVGNSTATCFGIPEFI